MDCISPVFFPRSPHFYPGIFNESGILKSMNRGRKRAAIGAAINSRGVFAQHAHVSVVVVTLCFSSNFPNFSCVDSFKPLASARDVAAPVFRFNGIRPFRFFPIPPTTSSAGIPPRGEASSVNPPFGDARLSGAVVSRRVGCPRSLR